MADRGKQRAAAFGRALREHREAKGLTQTAAAKAAGMTPQRWGQIEMGRERRSGLEIPVNPTRETVIKAARAVGWPADEALAEAGYSAESDEIQVEFPGRDWERLTEEQRQAFRALIAVVAKSRVAVTTSPAATASNEPVATGDAAGVEGDDLVVIEDEWLSSSGADPKKNREHC